LNTKHPKKIYRSRIKECDIDLHDLKRIGTLLSIIKLIIAAAGVFFLYKIAVTNANIYLLLLGQDALLFAIPAIIHEHFIRKRTFLLALKKTNEIELEALKHQFSDYSSGQIFVNEDHNYSSDLDIFGPKSLFHYLNRTTTHPGENELADWLRTPPGKDHSNIIRSRQEAVQELSLKLDLRQTIQAHGRMMEYSAKNTAAIPLMLKEPIFLQGKKTLVGLIHILPFLTIGSAGLMLAGLHWIAPLIFFSLQLGLNRKYKKNVHRVYKLSSYNARVLKAYSRIIREMENTCFSSVLLKNLKNGLQADGKTASSFIRNLSFLTALFEIKKSEILHPVFNSLLLWDLHCVYHIEKWRSRLGPHAVLWLRTIGKFEALSSLANLHFNHPEWAFPGINESGFEIQAESLGHFLIPPQQRVCNDIHLKETGNSLIITGPNMAGKSTFLKTIGINMVLAFSGSPVCARSSRFSCIQLYTSMKVSDSLDKQLSLFYAELQRLKKILDAINKKEKVFYLLDEMLKGTNVLDRKAGAQALLKQLIRHETLGIVATHDLELTKLEREFPDRIRNAHFDGYIEEDKLLFDYKLKVGKCESFNALALMRKIGINI